MKIFNCLLCLSIIFFLPLSYAHGQEKCVNAEAESSIIKGDIPSAKLKAIARAKWSAIEEVADTEISLRSIVQDFTLLDDVLKTKQGEAVKNYKIIDQKNDEGSLNVKIKACVDTVSAKDALYQLGLNNSVAVFIPARNSGHNSNEFQEQNNLSETLIDILSEQNYDAIDVAPAQVINAVEIEKAIVSGNLPNLQDIMYKFLSNLIIIGKVDYTISSKKEQKSSHGQLLSLNNVTVQFTYRILAKNNQTGKMAILAAGVEESKGIATEVEDAAAEAMKELAQNVAPAILNKIDQYIKDNKKVITIKVNDVNDIETVKKIKETLQEINWVSEIEEKQMGTFTLNYPENIVYLANGIEQKSDLKVLNLSPASIDLEYRD